MNPESLAAWLADTVPQWRHQRLGSIEELAGGWESDIYRFQLTHESGEEDLVLRRYSGENGATKARHEFGGMAKLHAFGYPVPRVIAAEPDPGPLGRPFMIMDWVPGEADRSWPDVILGPDLSGFVELQVRLHDLAWRPFTDNPDPTIGDTIAVWQMLTGLFPDLGFADAMRWIIEKLDDVTPTEPSVIHWDFHVGNVLVADDGATHVLDWTQIAVTDPRFDVAWTELLIAMAVSKEAAHRFRSEYESQRAPLDDMDYFEVTAAIKRLFSVAVSLRSGPEALGMRPEAAERMRNDAHTLAIPYATVQAATGLIIPAVEDLLA